ncbi:glycosyltransferase family 2 protein [Pelistega suis]|uniref:Glycosyltransferase n=1 Tax=Pelistega suis TaxID=1631957 RepID=A0A849P6G5_9BURK|nr:glycosyltransferase [Pelistega suis]NOL51613.1 glycosyltransferase [Pelistega suis]
MSIAMSFIIPMYNVAPYLQRCIDSILAQTISKEILLIDDGSTDETLNIALSYVRQYPFIHLVANQHQGVSSVRNMGLRLAKGEFVFFLDADDCLAPGLDLQAIYTQIETHYPEAVIVKGLLQIHLPAPFNTINTSRPVMTTLEPHSMMVVGSIAFTEHMVRTDNCFIHTGSYFIRRAFLREHSIYFHEQTAFMEDFQFLCDVFEYDKPIVEISTLFFYYMRRYGSSFPLMGSMEVFHKKAGFLAYLREAMAHTQRLKPYLRYLYQRQLQEYQYIYDVVSIEYKYAIQGHPELRQWLFILPDEP